MLSVLINVDLFEGPKLVRKRSNGSEILESGNSVRLLVMSARNQGCEHTKMGIIRSAKMEWSCMQNNVECLSVVTAQSNGEASLQHAGFVVGMAFPSRGTKPSPSRHFDPNSRAFSFVNKFNALLDPFAKTKLPTRPKHDPEKKRCCRVCVLVI